MLSNILSTMTACEVLAVMSPVTAGEGRVARHVYLPPEEVARGLKVSVKLEDVWLLILPVVGTTALSCGSNHWTDGLPVRPSISSVTEQTSE